MQVKICGITNLEDALTAVESGADALGFILAPESPRAVSMETVAKIIAKLPPFVMTVAVLTSGNIEDVQAVVEGCGVDRIQFHGDFPPGTIQAYALRAIQVIRVKDATSLEGLNPLPARAYLLDTYDDAVAGGSGKTFNWDMALAAKRLGKIILAGGLGPENVREAIRRAQPHGVDVSSGVESAPGKKDAHKLSTFIRSAKEAYRVAPE